MPFAQVEMMPEILAAAALISAMAVIALETTCWPTSAESFELVASLAGLVGVVGALPHCRGDFFQPG